MKILALEFSSEERSAALVQCAAGLPPVALGRAAETSGHRAIGLVSDALLQAHCEREDVEAIVVGLGPGSYTGIRGAIALAQSWQLGRGVRLLGLSSVSSVAARAADEKIFGPVLIVVDAQRNEFYLARYEIGPGQARETQALRLAPFSEIEQLARSGATIIGPDLTRLIPQGRDLYPDAAVLGRLACGQTAFVPGEKLEPIYLRQTAFKKAPPARALP